MDEEAGKVASCSSTVKPPNREDFEQSLSEINEQISYITEEIDKRLKEADFEKLKSERLALRDSRDKIKRQSDSRKPVLQKLKAAITTKDNQIMEMENDLIYKEERKLEAHIQELESTYNRGGFTSRREEQVLVKKLDTLYRNRTRLAKYNSGIEEKRMLYDQYNEEKRQQRRLFKDIRTISEKLVKIRQRTEYFKRLISELKSKLKDLYANKKSLIEIYNSQKEAYSSWSRNQKKQTVGSSAPAFLNYSYPATFPATRHGQHQTGRFAIEEEELEPFFEYKTACRRLIAYLESLQLQMEDTENNASVESTSLCGILGPRTEEDNDSADDFPSAFIRLKRYESASANSHTDCGLSRPLSLRMNLRKKANKRSAKKPTQSISHQLEFIRLFEEIGVDLPVCYQQVAKALEDVRRNLEDCKEQTNIIIWEESDYRNMPVPSDSSSESNWNGSADMSEVSSVGGNSIPPSPMPSSSSYLPALSSDPEDCNTVLNSVASLALLDNGIEDKDSVS